MKYWIIITLLLASCYTKAQVANTLDDELLMAEFNFWQANNDSLRFVALLNKVRIYRHARLYHQSLTEAYRAENYAITNENKAALKYEKMINSFLLDDYAYCATLTFDSSEKIENSSEIEFMILHSLNEAGNWERCKIEMVNCLKKDDTNEIKEIMTLPEIYTYKSPEKSRQLSSFLPGLSEVYAGYPVKGIASFMLNAGFLAFAVYNFNLNYYVTGCVSGILPMLKFYGGGKRLSAKLADRHNEKEVNRIKGYYLKEINAILK